MNSEESELEQLGYFLRDDTAIRRGAHPHFAGFEEAYSLFRRQPYERVHVFAGNRVWAVTEALKLIRSVEASK